MITASSLTNGPIERCSFSSSSSEVSIGHLIANLIYASIVSNEQEVWDCEQKIQQRLNLKEQVSCEDRALLMKSGYAISYRFETVDRFRNFQFIQNPELAHAIREATPDGGLLLDKYRAYHPGPASAKSVEGAAKGYGEILEIFGNQTKDSRIVRLAINRSLLAIHDKSLPENWWKEAITILDFSSDNIMGSGHVLEDLQKGSPNQSWRVISIDNQVGSSTSSHTQISTSTNHPRPAHFYMPDFLDSVPRKLTGQAQVIVMSQPHINKDQFDDFFDRIREWQERNTLLVFVNEMREIPSYACNNGHRTGLDPVQSRDEDFESEMNAAGYNTKVIIEETHLTFPLLNQDIEDQIIDLKSGDYENPYANYSEDFRTFKALMECNAGIPLEAMTAQERKQYLETLKLKFNANGGSFLKIVYKIIFACHRHSDGLFQQAFEEMDGEWCNFDESYRRARKRLALGYFQSAKNHLIEAMRNVQHKLNSIEFTTTSISDHFNEQLLKGFELLAEIHLRQGHYPQAAGLLWYTKRLKTHQGKGDPTSLRDLHDKIEEVEQVFLNLKKDPSFTIKTTIQSLSNKTTLNDIRQFLKPKLDTIKREISSPIEKASALNLLFKNMEYEVKAFIGSLVKKCGRELAQIGKLPPCDYAIFRVGPPALEMTPYSTIKIAILTNNSKDHPYFRDLFTLVRLKMINIGETPLSSLNIPELSWIDDTITPSGLNLDSDILHINLQSENLMPLEFLVGSQGGSALVDLYESRLHKSSISGNRKARAIKQMEMKIENLIPPLEEEGASKVQRVERDLHESINSMLNLLADYFSLHSKSNWDRIEELESRGVLTSTGAQNLKVLVMSYQGLCLSFHLANGGKKIDIECIEEPEKEAIICDLYYRAIPFYEAMKQFYTLIKNGKNGLQALHKERFFSPDPYTHGLTTHRLMKYRQADEAFSQVSDRTPVLLEQSGDVKQVLGQYREAVYLYQEAIALHTDHFQLARLYKKKGDMLNKLAQFKEDETGAGAAYTQSKKMILKLLREKKNLHYLGEQWCMISLSISKEKFDSLEIEIENLQKMLEEIYRALAYLEIEKANYQKAKEFLHLAKESTQQRLSRIKVEPITRIKTDLSLLENTRLEIYITQEFDSDFKKVDQLQREGRQILKSIYQWDKLPQATMNIVSLDRLLENLLSEGELSHYLKRTLAIRRATYGANHPHIASTMEKIGVDLATLGHLGEAIDCHEEAKKIRVKISGENHPAVAESFERLGELFTVQSSDDKAQAHYQSALNIRRTLFGEYHPLIAQSLNALAMTLEKLGNHSQALTLKKKALNIKQRIYGGSHPKVALIFRSLSCTLRILGNEQESLKSQMQSLDIYQKTFGVHNPCVAHLQSSIAYTLCSINQEQEALQYMKQSFENLQGIYGNYHSEVISAQLSLAWILERLNDNDNALKQNQEALDHSLKTFGEKNDQVAKCYNNLGVVLSKLKRHQEALKYKRQALALSKQLFGDDDPKVAKCLHNVGITLEILGHHKKAFKYQRRALDIWYNSPGIYDNDIGNSYYNIGNSFVNLGNYQNALSYYQLAAKTFPAAEKNPLMSQIRIHIPIFTGLITASGLLAEKDYDALYNHLNQIENKLKIITSDFSCWLFFAALLAKKKVALQNQLDNLVKIRTKTEQPKYSLRQMYINCILGNYYLQQHDIPNAMTYGTLLMQAEPQMLFTYRAIEVAGMNENPAVVGEQIPFQILGHYYVLRATQALQNMEQQAPSSSSYHYPTHRLEINKIQKLIAFLDAKPWTGPKASEIREYAQVLRQLAFNQS